MAVEALKNLVRRNAGEVLFFVNVTFCIAKCDRDLFFERCSMQATLALREAAAQLLAADAATLAPVANGNKIALVMADWTPSELTALGDLTFATFDGATPLIAGVGTQAEGLNPNTSDAVITIKVPAGGWRWETTGVTNLPQTIFGFALVDNGIAVLLASAKLPDPIVLTAVNQVINLENVLLSLLNDSLV